MEIYDVKLAEGVVVRVNANNPEDAKAKAKAVVAKKEGSKAYDKVFFDYETGIKDKALRAQLAVSEDYYDDDGNFVSEKENALQDYVGSGGFIRDSKGSLALTPMGQARLGLSPSNKNIVIDENKAFTSGDFADLAGYAGPVFGAIASVNPYMRGIKFLRGLLNSRIGRPLLVGAGSAAGKGIEEADEIRRGLQLQNDEEIAKMLKDEFVLGGVAQGAGEILGGIFATYFGKTANVGAIRDSKFLMDGYDLKDIFKMDSQIAIKKNILDTDGNIDKGFKATRNEVLKELKKEKIKPKFTPGIVTQAALGRSIPARGQSIAEAVTGASAREKRAKQNLIEQMNSFFKSIDNKNVSINNFVSSSAIGKTAAEELGKANLKINKTINVSNDKLDNLLKKMLDEMNTVRNLQAKGLNKESLVLKKELQDIMYESYSSWSGSNKEAYTKAIAALKNNIGDETITKALQAEKGRFKEILDTFDTEDAYFKYAGSTYNKIKDLAEGKVDNLQKLVNAKKEFKAIKNDLYARKQTSSSVYRAVSAADEGVDNLFKDIIGGKAFVGQNISADSLKNAKGAIDLLKTADKDFAQNIGKFQGTIYDDIVNRVKAANGGKGKLDAEEVFGFIDGPGNGEKIKEVLNAVQNASGMKKMEMYRGQLTALLFKNAIANSTDPVTKKVNPVSLYKNIMKYDTNDGNSTLKALFGPKYDQNKALLADINILKPNLTKDSMKKLINDIEETPTKYMMGANPITTIKAKTTIPPDPRYISSLPIKKTIEVEGPGIVPELNTGYRILQTIKERAKATFEADELSKKTFMRNVENQTPEKIVASIFRPNSAADINYIKQLVKDKRIKPETFESIKENAMGQLLTDAVSVGKLNSTSKLSDLFKPGNLRASLESYGDDTLEAMFGKEQLLAFKALQQSLDLQVGAAQGLTAGGIVAGAIGAQALNISLMPTILGLKIFANVMSRPSIVKLMANTDLSSTMIVIDAFEKAARLTLAQSLQEGAGQIESGITQELRKQIESPENQASAEKLRGQVEQIAKPLKASVPDLPDIIPTSLGAQNQAPISRSLLGGNPGTETVAESLGRLA